MIIITKILQIYYMYIVFKIIFILMFDEVLISVYHTI